MSSPPVPASPRRSSLGDWWTLAKPGITALICLVAVGGFLLADPYHISWLRLGLVVGFGALASAGSGMLNHYLERDRDRAMKRTRGRPLAAARVDPRSTAAVGLAFVALGVGFVWYKDQIDLLGHQVKEREVRLAELQRNNKIRSDQLATLCSTKELDARVKKLNLTLGPPAFSQVIRLVETPEGAHTPDLRQAEMTVAERKN